MLLFAEMATVPAAVTQDVAVEVHDDALAVFSVKLELAQEYLGGAYFAAEAALHASLALALIQRLNILLITKFAHVAVELVK